MRHSRTAKYRDFSRVVVWKVGVSSLVFAAAVFACAKNVRPPKPPAVAVEAAAPPPEPPEAAPPPLYTRLGGKDGVAGIIDSFFDNLTADKRLKKVFAKTKGAKLDHFKQMLADQICELTGGGCHYTGKTMTDAHVGMKITTAQFDAFIADFQLALDEKASQLSKDDTQQLMDLLTVLKDQIVEKK